MPLSARTSLIRSPSIWSTVPIGAPSAPMTFICSLISSNAVMDGLLCATPPTLFGQHWMHAAASLYACFKLLSSGGGALQPRSVRIDIMLPLDPADELVELDRLFGGNQGVGGRKYVFTGGLR